MVGKHQIDKISIIWRSQGFAMLSAIQKQYEVIISTRDNYLWAFWSLHEGLCSSPELTPLSCSPKITDCQSPSPGGGAKINVLPLLTALSPPSCRPLDISCETTKTPSKFASILQLHSSTSFTPRAWNEGRSTRAILSAWTAKAISRVLHQLTTQAFLPSLISSQGIFGRQKAGWWFSFK